MCSFKGKKLWKQHQVICRDFYCLFKKRKQFEIFIMSAEEQLVDCVLNTRGFIQTYFFIYSIDNFFLKKINFQRVFKKTNHKQLL